MKRQLRLVDSRGGLLGREGGEAEGVAFVEAYFFSFFSSRLEIRECLVFCYVLFYLGISECGVEGRVPVLHGVFECLNRLECSTGITCMSNILSHNHTIATVC